MLLQHGADGATLSLLPSWESPRAEAAKKVTLRSLRQMPLLCKGTAH